MFSQFVIWEYILYYGCLLQSDHYNLSKLICFFSKQNKVNNRNKKSPSKVQNNFVNFKQHNSTAVSKDM